ncbi:transposase [Streptomyces sp. NPDC002285]
MRGVEEGGAGAGAPNVAKDEARPGRQDASGPVAVDLGSQPLAWLSAPLDPTDPTTKVIAAARPYHADQNRLAKAQRALSRTQRGSKRRRAAARRVGRIYAKMAERRGSHLHHVSKRLATRAAQVTIEDLDLVGMTASAQAEAARHQGARRGLCDLLAGDGPGLERDPPRSERGLRWRLDAHAIRGVRSPARPLSDGAAPDLDRRSARHPEHHRQEDLRDSLGIWRSLAGAPTARCSTPKGRGGLLRGDLAELAAADTRSEGTTCKGSTGHAPRQCQAEECALLLCFIAEEHGAPRRRP